MFYHVILRNQGPWAKKAERTQENISKVAAESKLSTNKTKAISLWKFFLGMMYGPCLPVPTCQHNDSVCGYGENQISMSATCHPALLTWSMIGSTVKKSLPQEDCTGRTLTVQNTAFLPQLW